MRIETKFDLDEKVYFIEDNRIMSGHIDNIEIYVDGHENMEFRYGLNSIVPFTDCTYEFNEYKLFSSVKELVEENVKSLK